jgi:hypothetical protein
MTTLAWPHRARVLAALGADLTARPMTWEWTDIGGEIPDDTGDHRLVYQGIPIKRGRADMASRSAPAIATVVLDNRDGAVTPRNPRSLWYPHLGRGTPVRIDAQGPPGLLLDGTTAGNASTPDAAALEITGDFDLRWEGEIAEWVRGDDWWGEWPALVGRWKPAGNNRAYMMWVSGDILAVSWSTDGTDANARSYAAGILPVTTGRFAVRGVLDVNDGGAHTVRGYWAPSLAGPWEQIGEQTEAGTTSVYGGGTAPLEVGVITGEITVPFYGRCYAAEVRNAVGSVVANPDFEDQQPGATSFTDAAGRTWTLNGTAELDDWHTRHTGQIADVRPVWPEGDITDGTDPDAPGLARVTMTVAGLIRRLDAGAPTLKSTLTRVVTSPVNEGAVMAAWPMEDGRDAVQAASAVPGAGPMQVGGAWSFGSDSTLPAADSLPSVSANQSAGWSAPVPPPVQAADNWRVEIFVKIDDPHVDPASQSIFVVRTDGTVRTWNIACNDQFIALAGFADDGAFLILEDAASTEFFGNGWVRVWLAAEQSGGNISYTVGWGVVGGNTFGWTDTVAGTVGKVTRVDNLFTAPPSGVSFGHLIVSHDRPDSWLASPGAFTGGADTAYVGETAKARFRRLATEEGITHGVISTLDDPGTPMGPQRPAKLLTLFQECADAEQGHLTEMRDELGLILRTRASLYNQEPREVAADAGLVNPFEPAYDDSNLRNHVTASRPNGSSASVRRRPNIIVEGEYQESVTVPVATDAQLPDQAGWRVHQGTWPEMRYPSLAVDLSTGSQEDVDLFDRWLAAREGDRWDVTGLPGQHPPGPVRSMIEGSVETISPERWTVGLNCSPAGPWEVAVREDTVSGRRDIGVCELTGDVDEDDTVLEVETLLGPRWTTNAADLPFDIDLAGEQITVTGVADVSGQVQELTVTRSVNDIVKAHPAETDLALWHPPIRAL